MPCILKDLPMRGVHTVADSVSSSLRPVSQKCSISSQSMPSHYFDRQAMSHKKRSQ